jgi:hypothetical protein
VTPERGPDGKFLSSDSKQDNATPDTTQDNADTAPQADDGDDLARDDDGGLIDPPTIPSFERELAEAHAVGDDATIQEIQGRYTEAREDKARALAARDQEDDQ